MKFLAIILIYMSFFALIGFAVYWTKSANCLWALLLIPTLKFKSKNPEVASKTDGE